MHLLPLTVLDDFFEDPYSVRNYGLAQSSTADDQGRWPGTRTHNLSDLNWPLFDHTCRRIASLFYRIRNTDEQTMWQATGGFQLVDSSYTHGWVHHDATQELFTAIIYLTPGASATTGTSVYERNDITKPIPASLEQHKRASILGNLSDSEANTYRTELAAHYTESIRINNKFNRLLVFDSHLYHAANEFLTSVDTRLTLTLFFSKLGSTELSPVQRLRREVD